LTLQRRYLTWYVQTNHATYLRSDDGGSWLGPQTPRAPNVILSNSQCTLDVGASSAQASGTTLTLNLAFTFAPGFAGPKNVYPQAYDYRNDLGSGW